MNNHDLQLCMNLNIIQWQNKYIFSALPFFFFYSQTVMFLGVTDTSFEMYPSFTAPSKSVLHQHLNRDVFVISSNSDSDRTLLAVFQYAKSLSNKPGLRVQQLQRQHERDVYQLADLVHLHGHGSALLIGYWVANNMGYLHAARDKNCFL